MQSAILAGIMNDLGSGGNVDVTVRFDKNGAFFFIFDFFSSKYRLLLAMALIFVAIV